MKPLTDLEIGEFGYIVDLKDNNLTRELFELGCFPGDLIKVVENSPGRDFMTFRCRDKSFHLYKRRARYIITNVVSYTFCLN
jgi:Fe2+ transport system protein FeoA